MVMTVISRVIVIDFDSLFFKIITYIVVVLKIAVSIIIG